MSIITQQHHIAVAPRRVYVSFYFDRRYDNTDMIVFSNENFKRLLSLIGKNVYHTHKLSEIFQGIKTDYNKYYHFNRIRNAKKRMSSNQIRALTSSFKVAFDSNRILVRIPFTTIPILYFILTYYSRVIEDDYDTRLDLDKTTIGNYLCERQIYFMRCELGRMLQRCTDQNYINNCNQLYGELVYPGSFPSMKWTDLKNFNEDLVREHWKNENGIA